MTYAFKVVHEDLERVGRHPVGGLRHARGNGRLAEEGQLAPLGTLRASVDGLLERMALVGLTSPEPAWIMRMDVAVDGRCLPEDGKLLLDAEDVKARSYCRNLKTKQGEPFGLIRLEAEQRYDPDDALLESAFDPHFPADVWRSRFGALSASISRLPREVQTIEPARPVISGELRYSQGERLSMLVDRERIGLDAAYYPKSVLSSRRAEARKVGLAASEMNCLPLEVDLSELLAPYNLRSIRRRVREPRWGRLRRLRVRTSLSSRSEIVACASVQECPLSGSGPSLSHGSTWRAGTRVNFSAVCGKVQGDVPPYPESAYPESAAYRGALPRSLWFDLPLRGMSCGT
jgi:hypothetical protein